MVMNRVRFQAGQSMREFVARYGTEAPRVEAMAAQPCSAGVRCPACGSAASNRFKRGARHYWRCRHCRHQTTVMARAIFEATKLPLTAWFLGACQNSCV